MKILIRFYFYHIRTRALFAILRQLGPGQRSKVLGKKNLTLLLSFNLWMLQLMMNAVFNEKLACLANRSSFFLAGFGVAAWAPMIPFVRERYGLDEHALGLLLLCMGSGSFLFMPASSILAAKFGCRITCRIAAVLVGLVLCLVALVSNVYLTALLLFAFGMCSVTLDVTSNINAAELEHKINRPIMSGMHGMYSIGCFAGSLGFTFLLSRGAGLVQGAMAVAAVMAAVAAFAFVWLLDDIKSQEGADNASGQKLSRRKVLLHPVVLIAGVLCFIMFMTEGSVMDWSGVFLNVERKVPLEMAGYGYAAFSITMTIFRLSGDYLVKKLGRRMVCVCGTLLVVTGYVVAVNSHSALGAILGFALVGVGASNIVPQLVSFAASVKEVPVHISVAVINAIGFTGSLSGPALIGFAAHQITLPITFLGLAGLVLIEGIMLFFLLKRPNPAATPAAGRA